VVEANDMLKFTIVILIAGAGLTVAATTTTPGTTTKNLACQIPVVESSNLCQEINVDDRYKFTAEAVVSRTEVERIHYKTVKENRGVLSALNTSLAFPAETREATLNWVLRDSNGRIVATDTDHFGTIVGIDTTRASFEAGNLPSGEYTLETEFHGEGCGILVCAPITDTTSKTVEIPHLPLGDYSQWY
jgi:hypothetical protein